MKKSLLLIIGLSLAVVSCKKEEVEPEVEKSVDITLTNPTAGEMFMNGAEVSLEGTIEANFELHGYSITFYNESNNDSILFETDSHSHETMYNLHAHWTNNVTDHSNVRIEVIVDGDHTTGETYKEEVSIHCHPM